MNQALAVDARQQIDLRTGAAFTRLQTLTLQQRFPSITEGKNVISYGSCQFPTLGFIVEQYLRSINFIPEKFWLLSVNLPYNNELFKFKWERGHVFNELVCKAFHQVVKTAKFADVTIVNKKPTLK